MIERYTRQEMGAVWTQEARFRAWLLVELAVWEAWCELGMIPAEAMRVIREKADFDLARILEIEKRTRHDVIAFLSAVEEKVGPEARYIHLGCTSSDIVDTANALLLARAGALIVRDTEKLLQVLRTLALRWKGTLCMGRTHGVHAEPTSFGLKLLGFYAEFSRHLTRFKDALDGVRVGKISGAVGSYAFLSPELEAKACARLGLAVDPVSTQIIQRDRHAHYFTALALTAGGVERLCVELRHLQRTEVLEAEEGFGEGQKGSSAMPHKKNPISAENMAGRSRLIRTHALAALENMPLWHERDISHSSVERVIMPDATILADYVLCRLADLLENLRVYPQRMLDNMDRSFGLYASQRLLTAMINAGEPRQAAYEAVQRPAMLSWESRRPFADLAREDPCITKRLSAAELDTLFDPTFYLQHEDTVFARVLKQTTDMSCSK